MRLPVPFATVCLLAFRLSAALPPEYESLKAEAEKLYMQTCRQPRFAGYAYANVNEIYRQVALTNLPPEEQRWVKFRCADTQWRAEGVARRPLDVVKVKEARSQLEALIGDIKRVEDRDDVWAEAHASLGDLSQDMGGIMPPDEGAPHYQQAFEWLSAGHNGEPSPERMLAIVMRMTQPQGTPPHQSSYGHMPDFLPFEMLEKGIAIASTDEEKSHLHYLTAQRLVEYYGDPGQHPADDPVAIHDRIVAEFEAALPLGKTNLWWYYDALYNFVEWSKRVSLIKDKNGQWQRFEPDFVTGSQEDQSGRTDSAYFQSAYVRDQAGQIITNITKPVLKMSASPAQSGLFVMPPNRIIEYHLDWRNVKEIEMSVYALKQQDEPWPVDDRKRHKWLASIVVEGMKPTQSWKHDGNDSGDYKSHSLSFEGVLNQKSGEDLVLKPGAYLLEAKAGDISARELILITEGARF